MFYNISNHPATGWGTEQTLAAQFLGGELQDVKFPNVPPTCGGAEVAVLAEGIASTIPAGSVAMVMGDFSLTVALCRLFPAKGVKVVFATTDRATVETVQPDGSILKTSVFRFVRFRDLV